MEAIIAAGLTIGRAGPMGAILQAGLWGVGKVYISDEEPQGGILFKSSCKDDLALIKFSQALEGVSLPYSPIWFNCRSFVDMMLPVGERKPPAMPSFFNLGGVF